MRYNTVLPPTISFVVWTDLVVGAIVVDGFHTAEGVADDADDERRNSEDDQSQPHRLAVDTLMTYVSQRENKQPRYIITENHDI